MTTLTLRPFAPKLPEWRRSGHFLLLAAMLHGAVLAWPMRQMFDSEAPKPLAMLSVEIAHPAVPKPLAPAPSIEPPRPVAKSRPEPARPSVIAMAATPNTPATVPAVAPAAVENTPAPVAAAAAPAPTANPAPVSATITPARFNAAYLNNPEPKYPPLSRRLGEEGKVLLKVRVTPEGLAATVDLEKSSNFERLDAAAREVVAHWRFVPAKRGDQPIEASVIVPIVFRLEG
jgi:protein TonB